MRSIDDVDAWCHSYLTYVQLKRSIPAHELAAFAVRATQHQPTEKKLLEDVHDFEQLIPSFFAELCASPLVRRIGGLLSQLLAIVARTLQVTYDSAASQLTFQCHCSKPASAACPVYPTAEVGAHLEIRRFGVHPSIVPIVQLLVFWCNYTRWCEIQFYRLGRLFPKHNAYSESQRAQAMSRWQRQFVYAYQQLHLFFIGPVPINP